MFNVTLFQKVAIYRTREIPISKNEIFSIAQKTWQ